MTKEEIIQKGEKKFPPDEKLIIPNDRDEAAKEYAKTTFKKPHSENPDKEVTIVEPDKYAGFIAGAKWKKEQMMNEAVEGEYDSYPAAIYLETPVQGIEHGYYVGNYEVVEALRKLVDAWDD